MRKELVFKIKHSNYTEEKYCFYKYYIVYLSGDFGPLHIIIRNIKLYTDRMNVLAHDNDTLKYGKRLKLFSIKNLIRKGSIVNLMST